MSRTITSGATRAYFSSASSDVVRFKHFDVFLSREHTAAALDHHGMVVDDENAHDKFLVVGLYPCCEMRSLCQ